VYANEAQPLAEVAAAVEVALSAAPGLDPGALAWQRFDDELRAHRWDWEVFHQTKHEAINRDEPRGAGGKPFLLVPSRGTRRVGAVLVHGFSASPAEMGPLADRLFAAGYPCFGVRLKGHGTSPWDLLDSPWEAWLTSVRTGYEILSGLCERLCLIGFSAGGALALRFAAEAPKELAGVVAAGTPVKWRERGIGLAPAVHRANRMAGRLSSRRGVLPFYHLRPDHPEINYLHKPVSAIRELTRLVREMQARLPDVGCPVLLLQGDRDPVVDPRSAELIFRRLGSGRKELLMVPAERHGILYEGLGDTLPGILEFLEALGAGS
jgi:esterase/lipase